MLNRNMIGLLALALSAGLTLSACGDDSTENNADTGALIDAAVDSGTEDAGTDTADPGCTSDEDCSTSGFMCETSTGECVAAPSGCELTGADRPARCDETFDSTTFGPGSLVTSFEIAGLNAAGDGTTCCFDYNADQTHQKADPEIDNALGEALDGLYLGELNTSLADSINSGDLLLAFEHDGLTDLTAGESYGLNFFLGEYDTDDNLLIDPASLDEGTYPQARVNNAMIDGDALTAGPGVVQISVDLLGTPLSLLISDAKIETSIDTANSSIADGVTMTSGKLGGVIRVTDLLEAVNGYASSSCECLGLDGDPLIHYNPENVGCYTEDPNDPEDGMYQGKECGCAEVDASSCTNSCGDIAGFCGIAYGILPGLSDVDTDGDEEPDAVSIGANFETEATTFSGIAAE
jgi:hypothetical protein